MRFHPLKLESLHVESFVVSPYPYRPLFQQAVPTNDAGCGGNTGECGGGNLPTFDIDCLGRTIGGTGTC